MEHNEIMSILRKYFVYDKDECTLTVFRPSSKQPLVTKENTSFSIKSMPEVYKAINKPAYTQLRAATICFMLLHDISDFLPYVKLDIKSQGLHPNNLIHATADKGRHLNGKFIKGVPRIKKIEIFKLDPCKNYGLVVMSVARIINEALQHDIFINKERIARLLNIHEDVRAVLYKAIREKQLAGIAF